MFLDLLHSFSFGCKPCKSIIKILIFFVPSQGTFPNYLQDFPLSLSCPWGFNRHIKFLSPSSSYQHTINSPKCSHFIFLLSFPQNSYASSSPFRSIIPDAIFSHLSLLFISKLHGVNATTFLSLLSSTIMMTSQTPETTPSHFGVPKDFTMVAFTEAPMMVKDKEVALNSVVPTTLSDQVMLPFFVDSSTFSFIGPLLDQEEAEQARPFFPCMKNRDIIASQEKIHHRYFASLARLFRNNPKNTEDYIMAQQGQTFHGKSLEIIRDL